MALGFVQGTFANRGTAGTIVSKAFSINVTAGDIIVVTVMCPSTPSTMTMTNSGTAGISWSGAGTQVNTGGGTSTWYRNDATVNTTGSCTVTATSSVSLSYANLYIGEFNVGGHVLTRDGSPNYVENTQATTTSFASGSITTTNNPALLVCFYDNNGSTTAFTGGITAGWAENVWDSGNQVGFASSVVTTAAAYSLTATQISGGDDSVILAYQATASGTTLNPFPGGNLGTIGISSTTLKARLVLRPEVFPGLTSGTLGITGVVTPRLNPLRPAQSPGLTAGTLKITGVVNPRTQGVVPTFIQGVNTASSSGSATVSLAFGSSQVAGDCNVVFIGTVGGETLVSVTDSNNGTYLNVLGPYHLAGDTLTGYIYVYPNINSGLNTVTVTFGSNATFPYIAILEYSGVHPTQPVDALNQASGLSGTSSLGVTTTKPNDAVVIGWLNDGNGWNGTPGTGFTNRLFDSGSGQQVDDLATTVTGTYVDTPTNQGGSWMGVGVALRPFGASGAAIRPGAHGTLGISGIVFPRLVFRPAQGPGLTPGILATSGIVHVHGLPITPGAHGTWGITGIVHGRLNTPNKLLITGSANPEFTIRPLPPAGLLGITGRVLFELVGVLRPQAHGTLGITGVVTPRLNPLRPAIYPGLTAGTLRITGVVNPRTGIVRPFTGGNLGTIGISAVMTVRLVLRPGATGTILTTGGTTTPRFIYRPSQGPGLTAGTLGMTNTVMGISGIPRMLLYPGAHGTISISGVVNPEYTGVLRPQAFGTFGISGQVTPRYNPFRPFASNFSTATINISGIVTPRLVMPSTGRVVTVASRGEYVILNVFGAYDIMFLQPGVNYAYLIQTVELGPYPDFQTALAALLTARDSPATTGTPGTLP